MIFLGLGSNLGNRENNIKASLHFLQKNGVMIQELSSVYETDAWGNPNQESYLNMVVGVETELSVEQLLATCLVAEKEAGRVRLEKWGPRIIDIDIILYENKIINSDNLIVPHPLFAERKFVLIPLAEIAPNLVDPISKKSIVELLQQCPDKLEVKFYSTITL